MKIYCLGEFIDEVKKLKKNNSYSGIEKVIIKEFFNKTVDELKKGDLLNNSEDIPYIKKRLGGKGGFRCYCLLIVKNNCIYLSFIHPKTGSLGASNITPEAKADFLKLTIEAIKTDSNLYEIQLGKKKDTIEFVKKQAQEKATL